MGSSITEDPAVAMQGAGDLHLLLFGNGQGHHPVAGLKLSAETIYHRLGLMNHLFALYQSAARQLAAEENVLSDG